MKNYTSRPIPDHKKLKDWYDHRKNILLISDHGIGKTSVITNFCFAEKIKFATFSGATLDPWTDLIGIPRPIKEGKEYKIEYVRPQTVPDDIELIFIDEVNRSHPKVRNALMELMQFKSINGKKFKNLRVVWAAANPVDSELNYDVEELDPAQEDRFHVIYKIRRELNFEYLEGKFGKHLATEGFKWWSGLGDEAKRVISPRRIDYILEAFNEGGDLRDLIPYEEVNVTALRNALDSNPNYLEFRRLFSEKDKNGMAEFLNDSAKWQGCKRKILDNYDEISFVIPLLPTEELISNCVQFSGVATLVAGLSERNPEIKAALDEIKKSGIPEWLVNAQLVAQNGFVQREFCDYFDNFNKSSLAKYSVGTVANDLMGLGVDQILGDLPNVIGEMVDMDEKSAMNFLNFAFAALSRHGYEIIKVNPDQEFEANRKKFIKLVNSALLSIYNKYANFGAIYYYLPLFFNYFTANTLPLSNVKESTLSKRPTLFPQARKPNRGNRVLRGGVEENIL